MDKGLKIGITVSIMLHGAIAFLPTISFTDSQRPVSITEVDIIERKIELPSPVDLEQAKVAQRPPVRFEKKPGSSAQNPKQAAESITRLAEEVSFGQGTILPDLKVDLPKAELEGEQLRLSEVQLRRALTMALFDKLEEGTVIAGSKQAALLPWDAPQPLPGRKEVPVAGLSEDKISRASPQAGQGTSPRAEAGFAGLDIKGPAAERRVIFRPPPIGVEFGAEADIELKFWILPDGAVGRVVPLRKGDARLEDEAMRYIKKWRFNQLSKENPQEEQWGTVAIKFLLR